MNTIILSYPEVQKYYNLIVKTTRSPTIINLLNLLVNFYESKLTESNQIFETYENVLNDQYDVDFEEIKDEDDIIDELEYELDIVKSEYKDLETEFETRVGELETEIEKLMSSIEDLNNFKELAVAKISSASNYDVIVNIDLDNKFKCNTISEQNDKLWKFMIVNMFNYEGKVVNTNNFDIINEKKSFYKVIDKELYFREDKTITKLIKNQDEMNKLIKIHNHKKVFTIFEFNENYLKHCKNFMHNSIMVCQLLLPYIYDSLPIEVKLKMLGSKFLIPYFIIDEKTFEVTDCILVIYYTDRSETKKYIVKHKFVTNLAFNFIDANLYADKLITKIKDRITKDNNYMAINNKVEEIKQLTKNKVNFVYYNNNNSIFSESNKKYAATVLKLDFNFNECLNSENILDFFKYLQNYNEFYFDTKTDSYDRLNLMNKTIPNSLPMSNVYYNKIKSHYIKSNNDISIDDIPDIPLRYNVYPDIMMVTEEFKIID